jgi:hypothetical protein
MSRCERTGKEAGTDTHMVGAPPCCLPCEMAGFEARLRYSQVDLEPDTRDFINASLWSLYK